MFRGTLRKLFDSPLREQGGDGITACSRFAALYMPDEREEATCANRVRDFCVAKGGETWHTISVAGEIGL